MAITRESLLAYLTNDLDVDVPLEDDTLIFSTSVIDSFQMMSLIERLEKTGGFRIPPEDVTLENLDSVGRILAYVKQRSGG